MPFKQPWFWAENGLTAKAVRAALSPASAAYDLGQRWRTLAAKPTRAAVPVICVGNATVGGVGKTPFALRLADALAPLIENIFFLTRGYGGRLRGPLLVDPTHAAHDVGDEPLLLAARRPTAVSADRPAGAALAAAEGARAIIMDDGYQNPSIEKDVSILLLNASPQAAHAIFPAGPMREPVERAAARADAIVTIGQARTESAAPASSRSDAFLTSASLEPIGRPDAHAHYVAFCGIARPERFFETLRALDVALVDAIAFPDHHPISEATFAALRAKAAGAGAKLITTSKDAARLTPAQRELVVVLEVEMRIENERGLIAHIADLLDSRRPGWRDA